MAEPLRERDGLKGLKDDPRSGRPAVISEDDKGRIIVTACTLPDQLGQAFGHWTLDRLTVYANETLGIAISRAHIGRVLRAEGLRWYQEQTYFSERVDPQFAERRGHRRTLPAAASRHPCPVHRRDGTGGGQDLPISSADTSWDASQSGA